jgi:hypothetical protein
VATSIFLERPSAMIWIQFDLSPEVSCAESLVPRVVMSSDGGVVKSGRKSGGHGGPPLERDDSGFKE